MGIIKKAIRTSVVQGFSQQYHDTCIPFLLIYNTHDHMLPRYSLDFFNLYLYTTPTIFTRFLTSPIYNTHDILSRLIPPLEYHLVIMPNVQYSTQLEYCVYYITSLYVVRSCDRYVNLCLNPAQDNERYQ